MEQSAIGATSDHQTCIYEIDLPQINNNNNQNKLFLQHTT